ncbi:MAG: LPXTG cell wall anchor domain-containing protein [Chloroflexota bacterium]|nr:LPXTG cell wall anchor domain-containing protein [Chloroflexota bacterium]
MDNGDGIFNGYDDGLDACCCGERGFNIYPELPTSILFGIGLVGLAGVSGFIVRRRKQSAHKVDQII